MRRALDTARFGHMVSFLRPDRQPAAQKMLVQENHANVSRTTAIHPMQFQPSFAFHLLGERGGIQSTTVSKLKSL
jgi:hypothetical protein